MRFARVHHGIALTALAAIVLSACTAASGATPSARPVSGTPSASASPTPTVVAAPPVQLESNLADRATVEVNSAVTVWASEGTLDSVTLTAKGEWKENPGKVPGKLSEDKSSWAATRFLDPGRTYLLQAQGTNADGVEATRSITFKTRTMTHDEEVLPYPIPGDGTNVGVAMPVVVSFDLPVTRKADFERAMTVTTSPKQKGTWHWVSDREIHWRPEKFWKPGTKVTLDAKLNGVPAGEGRYGQNDLKGSFTVARSLVAKVDLNAHRMNVYVGGKLINSLPMTGGKPGFESRYGTKVIMGHEPKVRMKSDTTDKNNPDFYDLDVSWNMRLTWSGEYIHAAPWSAGNHGYANVSHGCVGLTTDRAIWAYNTFLMGDPVIVTGSNRPLEEGNGWTDWNHSFADYAKGSALK